MFLVWGVPLVLCSICQQSSPTIEYIYNGITLFLSECEKEKEHNLSLASTLWYYLFTLSLCNHIRSWQSFFFFSGWGLVNLMEWFRTCIPSAVFHSHTAKLATNNQPSAAYQCLHNNIFPTLASLVVLSTFVQYKNH